MKILVSIDLVNKIIVTDNGKQFFFNNQLDKDSPSESLEKILDEICSKINFENVSNVIFCCPDTISMDDEYFIQIVTKRTNLQIQQIFFVGCGAPVYDFWIDQLGTEINLNDIVVLIRVRMIEEQIYWSASFFAVRIEDEKPISMVSFENIPPTNDWRKFKDSYKFFKNIYENRKFLKICKFDDDIDTKILEMLNCKFLKSMNSDRANGALIRLKTMLNMIENKILAEEFPDKVFKPQYFEENSRPSTAENANLRKLNGTNEISFRFKDSSEILERELLPERPKDLSLNTKNSTEKTFFGIDLGTTSCCIAMATKMSESSGQTRCAIKELSTCFLSILDEDLKLAKMDDQNIVFDAKRMIGRNLEEVSKLNNNKWPFDVVEHRSRINISLNGTKITPEFVLSKLLENLIEDAEKQINVPIQEAVIAVPTNFNQNQKESIKAAAIFAGIQVTELIDEPVATYYDFKRTKIGQKSGTIIFIADLGGGTFDAAVVEENPQKEPKICCSGNAALGGRDFDAVIADMIMEKITARYPNYADFLMQKDTKNKLIIQAETAKKLLSTAEVTEIKFNSLIPNLLSSAGNFSITRADFEKRAENLVKLLKNAVDEVLEKAEQANISHVILVGGGCKMACLQKIIKEKFPNLEFDKIEKVEYTVARGAAWRAYNLGKKTSP